MLETSEGNETTMSYSGVAHAGPPQPSSQATQPSGDASMPSPPFPSSLAPIAPAPWRLRATVYALFYWTSSSEARELATPGSRLHSLAYPALEGASGFGRPGAATSGTPVGGMSMIQLLRYSDTPVGPYDEMVLLPGLWEYEREVEDRKGGKRRVKKRHLRVSRIYVSTTDTAINGRRNWGIPKHLARFEWTDHPDGSTSIAVYPLERHHNPQQHAFASGSHSRKTPFFATTFRPSKLFSWIPPFYFSTRLDRYLGLDWTLAQPPLPDGTDGSTTVPEVTGTQKAGSSKDITAGPVSNGAGKSVANEDSGANRSSGSTDGSQAECRDDGNDRGASGPEPAWVLHPCAEWCHIAAAITTRHATIGWLDMRQPAKRGRGSQPNLEQHAGAQSDVSGAETQEMPQQPTVAASTAASSGGMDGTGKDFGGGESRRMAVGEDGIMDGRDEDVESGQTGWDNFLPGMGRWRLAMKMEDAILDFPAAERWAPATSREEGRASQDLEAVCR